MDIAKKLKSRLSSLGQMAASLVRVQEALARIEARQLQALDVSGVQENEFRGFSQWGEDGIIQYLVRVLALGRSTFIEFGVETYVESSTRFLLINNNWSGLVIDGSQANIDYIKRDEIYWRYNLKAECAFVTAETINQTIERSGMRGQVGLLSVDIDGVDYWVWKAIDVVSPAIVIVEYNSSLGPDLALTVPYDASFVRSQAHHSMIYYGASLAAFTQLGHQKGYALVGCNSAGNNAFFVRKDLLPESLPELTPRQAFVSHQFREARKEDGGLAYLSADREAELLKTLPFVDVAA